MFDRYSTAWNEFVWIEAIFTFTYTWICTMLKINWGVHSAWGIVVNYTVGSLGSSCKAFHYPKMSLVNACKKEKEIYKTNIYFVADDCCSTNYEVGFFRFIDKHMKSTDISHTVISCRWRSSYQKEVVITFWCSSWTRTRIFNTICGGLLFVQRSNVDFRYVDIGTNVGQYCLNFRCIKRNSSNHQFKWQTIWLLDWGVIKISVLIWYTFFLIHHFPLRACVNGFLVAGLLSSDFQLFVVLIYCFHSSYPHMQNLSLESLESSTTTTLFSIPYLVHDFNQWKIQNKTISLRCTKKRRNIPLSFINVGIEAIIQLV